MHFACGTCVLVSWACKKAKICLSQQQHRSRHRLSLDAVLTLEGSLVIFVWDTVLDVLEPPVVHPCEWEQLLHSSSKRIKSNVGTRAKPFGRRTLFDSSDWATPSAPRSSERANEAAMKILMKELKFRTCVMCPAITEPSFVRVF